MKNIICFELKRITGRLSSYIYLALILAFQGYFITSLNLYAGTPGIEYSVYIISLPLLFCLPILTFSSVSADRATGFDSVLNSLGATPIKLVLGKFISLSIFFLASSLPIVITPFIFSFITEINFISAFSGIVGYLLFGVCTTSVGVFVSALTPKPLFSILISYAAMAFIYICEIVQASFYFELTAAFFVLTVFALLISLALMFLTRSDYAWLILFAILEALILIFRFACPSILTFLSSEILMLIGFRYNLLGFCYGIFDISSAVNILTVTALMLLLCILSLEFKKFRALK